MCHRSYFKDANPNLCGFIAMVIPTRNLNCTPTYLSKHKYLLNHPK